MAQASPVQTSESAPSASAAKDVLGAAPVTHEMNAAGSQPKGVMRWGWFFVLNGISGVIAVAIFIGLFYADGMDRYLRGMYEWLLAHPGVTSFFAFSPLSASLLVGWGYGQRAKKRKAAAARAEAERAAASASA